MIKESAAKETGVDGDSIRHSALAMDAATFRGLGHRLVDQLADFLKSLPRGPVTHNESPSTVRDALDVTGPLPDLGMDPAPLLERTAQLLFDHSLFNGHPRFFVLRACIVNFHTARADVEALPEIVARIGRAVDAELRPTISERHPAAHDRPRSQP